MNEQKGTRFFLSDDRKKLPFRQDHGLAEGRSDRDFGWRVASG